MAYRNGMANPTPRPATDRLVAGQQQISAAVAFLIGRTSWSYPELCRICDWAMGEHGWLNTTDLSRIRNARLARGASFRNLLALAATNHASWLWHERGEAKALEELGAFSSWGVTRAQLNAAVWLEDPRHPGQPLEFGAWCEVQAGLLKLPYLTSVGLSATALAEACRRLADLLNAELDRQAGGPRAALEALRQAYQVTDSQRWQRLQRLVLAGEMFTAEELESELWALAETVRRLRELPPSDYGVSKLQAELSAPPKPNGSPARAARR